MYSDPHNEAGSGYNDGVTMRSPRFSGLLAAVVLGLVLASATSVVAGPWSELPAAVSRLEKNPEDSEARQVLARAEVSVLRLARTGRLAAVRMLIEAYQAVVSPLPDAGERIDRLRGRVAVELSGCGERRRSQEPREAGAAWALALELDPESSARTAVAELLLPPKNPRPGQVWTSPLDAAELVWLPPFRFLMGCTPKDKDCRPDEKYLRWVSCHGIWMERTEVTNERYLRCVEAGGCTPPKDGQALKDPARREEPVSNVTWRQAAEYAYWAGRRLPSEAEWERAARGKRTDWRYPWGNYRMRERSNVRGTASRDVWEEPAPVASFPWTGWGLYDLAGNLWEWCEDTYHENLVTGPKDGSAWTEGGRGRVIRGGSWRRSIEYARVSARAWLDSGTFTDDVGFRCAADAASSLDRDDLPALASTAFPSLAEPGTELDDAGLDAADRRYLERRAVTWLLLEGRPWDALPRAVLLLQRDPSDPVAGELLERLEGDLGNAAAQGDTTRLGRVLKRFRAAVQGDHGLEERAGRVLQKVAASLKKAAAERRRRGDTAGARQCVALGLEILPEDEGLQRMLQELIPEPGARRAWPGDGRQMVWIPSGSCLMGRSRGDTEADTDEQPAHTVHIRGFWFDRAEVTNEDYRKCVEAGECTPPNKRERFDDPAYADHPVLWVNWYQARSYAVWAGKRLPSEAEWEYAARAGSSARYPWGEEWMDGRANGFGTKGLDTWMGSSPAGSFRPNPWGLVDMLGNAWEWVLDVYNSDFKNAPRDGRAWVQVVGSDQEEADRVLRGGSYLDFPPKLRLSQRDHRDPGDWSKTTGFRCAADGD